MAIPQPGYGTIVAPVSDMVRHASRLPFALLVFALVFFGAGCVAGSAWPLLLSLILSGSALLFTGCGDSHPSGDATVDGGGDGGTWEPCCSAGMIDTCYCPPDTICNYGLYTDCGDGTCLDGPAVSCPGGDAGSDAAPSDAGMSDASDVGPSGDGSVEADAAMMSDAG